MKPVAHCVFCKEPLTTPALKKWWIGGSHYDEGLCYDCILTGMRVIMAGVQYSQDNATEIQPAPNQPTLGKPRHPAIPPADSVRKSCP